MPVRILPILCTTLLALPAAEFRPTDLRGDPDPHTSTRFTPRSFDSVEAWATHQSELRRRVLTSAGLWPMPAHGAVRAHFFGQIVRDGYTVEKLLIETLPGFHVGANLYRPTAPGPKRPGVLVAHGHWKNGRIEHNEAYSVPALGAALARNGYIALAYDMIGYGDTHQLPHKFGDSSQEQNWSFGPMGLQLWNSIRVLDYLASRSEIDPSRLAITGASGGGTQTYLLAAVDDRIRVSIPAGMVSYRFQGNDPCEMAPGLRVGTNNMELAAAVAPRPMLLLSSTRDWTSLAPILEYPAIRNIYGLLGWASRVESHLVDSEHGYNAEQRRAAIEFLNKHFNLRGPVVEPAEFPGPPTEFLIGASVSGGLPGAASREGVFRAWQRLLQTRNLAMTPPQKVELLRQLTGGAWPARVYLFSTRGDGFLHRDGANDVVPARLFSGSTANPVIAVSGKGSTVAAQLPAAVEARNRGDAVLAVDLFATGTATVPAHGRYSDHLVFHYSDDANRVQDILTAAAWFSGNGATSVRLLCADSAEAWCRLASAISPFQLHVETDHPRGRRLSIPGLAAAGYRDKIAVQ